MTGLNKPSVLRQPGRWHRNSSIRGYRLILDSFRFAPSFARTAEACGVHGVILQDRRSPEISARVVIYSAGAAEHLRRGIDNVREAAWYIFRNDAANLERYPSLFVNRGKKKASNKSDDAASESDATTPTTGPGGRARSALMTN